jgi:hypothetical protein
MWVAGEVHKFLQQSSLLPYRAIRLISIDALGGSSEAQLD